MKVVSSGHGLKVRGASSKFMDEVDQARRVVNRVEQLCKEMGDPIIVFHENVATSVNGNLSNIVSFHNSKNRTLDVSIHFNSYNGTASGVEVWGYNDSAKGTGEELCKRLSSAMGVTNRGFKKSTELYFLRKTTKPALLIEVCFLDNEKDVNAYMNNFEKVCIAIAEVLTGKTYKPTTPPPTEGKTKFYRVIAGSYTVEAYAKEVEAKLKAQNIDAFIDVFYK